MALTFSQHTIKTICFNNLKKTSDLILKKNTNFITVTIANSIGLSLWGSFNNSVLPKQL